MYTYIHTFNQMNGKRITIGTNTLMIGENYA